MAENGPLDMLRDRFAIFYTAAEGVPDDRFLTPMSAGGWSVRDTIAHLAGWNWEMIRAGQDILAGKAPDYYAESGIDYRDLNAGFVATYSSEDKSEMLNVLSLSMSELEDFVVSLDIAELEADRGVVHYRSGAATVARTLDSLGRDYQHHAEEVREWLDKKAAE